jgi:pyridoxal phosphate enzyme (YggS family)
MDIDRLRQNLGAVRGRMEEAARRAGRPPAAVRLVVVTKLCPSEWIGPLVELGVRDFGENYPQELWRKHDDALNLKQALRWHLIGHLQTNKVKKTLPMVSLIHSVDSLKLLRRLDEAAPALTDAPGVCLQVNTSGEVTKHGWTPEEILRDAESISACRAIPIVGLMTMAAYGSSVDVARRSFARLRELRDTLRETTDLGLVELSMGMSGDFETAIEEGATLVRIGTVLFEGVES